MPLYGPSSRRSAFKATIRRAVVGTPGFSADRMLQFGNILNNDIQRRFDEALNVYDEAAPALAKGYEKFKVDGQYHGEPIRNLRLTGRLRRGMRVLRASQNHATLGFSDPVADERMTFNQRRSNMYGASPRNLEVVLKVVNEYASEVVSVTQVVETKTA